MAEAVVDLLEAVEVDEQHRERVARPLGPRERLVEPVAEQRAVGEPGEAVVERLPGQLLLEPHALGDVAGVEDDAADLPVVAQVGDVRLEVAPLAEPVPHAGRAPAPGAPCVDRRVDGGEVVGLDEPLESVAEHVCRGRPSIASTDSLA